MEHLQIAKSRGKGAPKKKRTAAGKRARKVFEYEQENAIMTASIQRARSSTARRGNDRILGLKQIFIARSFGIRCIEVGTVQYGHADTMTTSVGSCDLLCGRSACITYFLLSTSLPIKAKLW